MLLNTIKIENKDYQYYLKRSNRAKYIRIELDKNGLIKLILPQSASIALGESFITEKIEWIKKNQRKFKNKGEDSFLKEYNFLFLGKKIPFQFCKIERLKNYSISFANDKIIIRGNKYNENLISKLYIEWLRVQAKNHIPKRVKYWAERNGFNYNKVFIKNLKSKWGSCSNKKNLNFNLKLMQYDKEIIDYIIVHELSHLREMNHSKKFWDIVESIIPNYKLYEKELKKGNGEF